MTLWTVAHQALLSVGFPRQEYWSGLPFSPPGDLLNIGRRFTVFCTGRQILYHWEAPVSSVKNMPAMQETLVSSLVWEDTLEKEVIKMTTHSSILAWEFPWTEEPGGLQSMGSQSLTQLRD